MHQGPEPLAPPAAGNLLICCSRPREDLIIDIEKTTIGSKSAPNHRLVTLAVHVELWQHGRNELFYPYGKTYAQTLGEQD